MKNKQTWKDLFKQKSSIIHRICVSSGMVIDVNHCDHTAITVSTFHMTLEANSDPDWSPLCAEYFGSKEDIGLAKSVSFSMSEADLIALIAQLQEAIDFQQARVVRALK